MKKEWNSQLKNSVNGINAINQEISDLQLKRDALIFNIIRKYQFDNFEEYEAYILNNFK
jgi:hypothetical protein